MYNSKKKNHKRNREWKPYEDSQENEQPKAKKVVVFEDEVEYIDEVVDSRKNSSRIDNVFELNPKRSSVSEIEKKFAKIEIENIEKPLFNARSLYLFEKLQIAHQNETIDIEAIFNAIQDYCHENIEFLSTIISSKKLKSINFLQSYESIMIIFSTLKELQVKYNESYQDYIDNIFMKTLWQARYEIINVAAKSDFDEFILQQWISRYFKEIPLNEGFDVSTKENESPMISKQRKKIVK
eukprot:gene12637-6541_t